MERSAGPALAERFHFARPGERLGRPLGRGSSAIAGFFPFGPTTKILLLRQARATTPVQAIPQRTPAINQLINVIDRSQPDSDPVIRPSCKSSVRSRGRNRNCTEESPSAGNSLSLGKQELYWGPTTMGPLAFSSNAEPTYNLRFVSTRPHPFPFVPISRHYRFRHRCWENCRTQLPGTPLVQRSKGRLQTLGTISEISFTRCPSSGVSATHHVP